jgi:hypothetical protein
MRVTEGEKLLNPIGIAEGGGEKAALEDLVEAGGEGRAGSREFAGAEPDAEGF